MEDAATVEISRSQIWQWIHSDSTTDQGVSIAPAYIRKIAEEETERPRSELGHAIYDASRFEEAKALFETVALSEDFPDFLTLPAYTILED
jgi:malate synthase